MFHLPICPKIKYQPLVEDDEDNDDSYKEAKRNDNYDDDDKVRVLVQLERAGITMGRRKCGGDYAYQRRK